MKKRIKNVFITLALLTALTGCGSGQEMDAGTSVTNQQTETSSAEPAPTEEQTKEEPANEEMTAEQSYPEEQAAEEVKEKMLKMKIGDTAVAVDWENNESVEALKALCKNEPLVIQMSMYGGFEQVGSIGARLPSDDEETVTSAGDIVLYSSSQIVVFYGSNSWAYTRLGHITDQGASGMAALLGSGDVTITISMED